ncbi:unnamed protein product [Linum trigynum]|uniref:Epidermal patterning factor-like protein n=1 Tax=Linum trigynum TaxID=586398 RepID=A0AAV2FF79_9ROSI
MNIKTFSPEAMAMLSRRRRHSHRNHLTSTVATAFTFLFLCLFLSSTTALAQLGGHQGMTKAVRDTNYEGKVVAVGSSRRGSVKALMRFDRFMTQKRMGGPGSSPPTCRSKCGVCAPCRPVHVPVQPGVSFPLEYYPEAWRCQCGTKLFMP